MKRLLLVALLFLPMLPASLTAEGLSGWTTARTKHFVFVYNESDQSAVDALLSFAEGVYAKVTSFLDSYPKTIWVVVDGSTDTANGAFELLPPHLVLYVAPPSVPVLGSKEHRYLRMLLTHELTHYVHLDYNRGFFSALSHLFGPAVKPADAAFLPGWMMEGVAVNDETMFTHGGRGRDPYFQMVSKALILDNHFFTLAQAGYGSAFPPEDRVYVGGYLMVHYLLTRFGMDTVRKIHEEYVKFPLLGPWAAIKKVTGMSARTIFRDMKVELAHRYARYRRIASGSRVSPKGIGSYYLPIVTKRGWYEYRSNLDSAPAIVRFDPTTGKQTVLIDASLTDYSSFTATPDGRRIVFATFEVTPGTVGQVFTSDLFSYDPLTEQTRRITRDKHLWQPALSPDGRLLVAVQRRGDYTRLVVVHRSTGGVTPLFARPQTNVYNPIFSPNGRLLAFAFNDRGRQRIMLLDVAAALRASRRLGGGPSDARANAALARPLPRAPEANAYFPRFAGNASVLFTADLGNGLALYEAPVSDSGGRLLRVAEDPVGVASGFILGKKVIYSTYSPDGYVVMERPVTRVAVAGGERSADHGTPSGSSSVRAAARATGSGSSALSTAAPLPASPGLPAGRPYRDWPRFLFWLPLPVYDFPGLVAGDRPFGLGLIAYGESLLGRNSYSASVTFRSDILQPALNLSLSSAIGATTLGYGLSEGYTGTASDGYSQSVGQNLDLAIPIVAQYLMGVTTNFTVTPGLFYGFGVASPDPFSVAAPFQSPASFTEAHGYSLGLGLSFSRIRWGAPRDIFPPHDLELDLQESYSPPVFSTFLPGLASIFRGSLSFPSLFAHQVVRLDAKASYSTTQYSSPRTPLVDPRGLFPSAGSSDPLTEQTTPGRSVVGVDYLATLALLDTPLPFGFNLQGLGLGLHLEAAAGWGPGQFTPDPYLYAGVELVSLVGYYGDGGSLPIGIGVSFRFSPGFSRPFDPLHDIGPYFFIGTDSFAGSQIPLTRQLISARRPRVDF